MIWVTDARTLPDYRLWVRFSDATEGAIDLKDFIASDTRPIVSDLRELAAFSAIRVEMDTVVWSSGFDLAPEFRYSRAMAQAYAWTRTCSLGRSADGSSAGRSSGRAVNDADL